MFVLGPKGPIKIPYWLSLCPKCRSWHGDRHVCLPPPPPTAKNLFPIPARPRDNRWRVEWRWKPAFIESLAGMETGANDWVEHRGDGALPTEAVARNRVAVLRREFPCKSWRMRGYHVGVMPYRERQWRI